MIVCSLTTYPVLLSGRLILLAVVIVLISHLKKQQQQQNTEYKLYRKLQSIRSVLSYRIPKCSPDVLRQISLI